MKDLLLQACVVVRTSNMKTSRRHLADYVKTMHQKACRTCSTIIFPRSTNQVIDLWRCLDLPSYNNRDFKIVHDGRLGRLDAYTGDLGRVR